MGAKFSSRGVSIVELEAVESPVARNWIGGGVSGLGMSRSDKMAIDDKRLDIYRY